MVLKLARVRALATGSVKLKNELSWLINPTDAQDDVRFSDTGGINNNNVNRQYSAFSRACLQKSVQTVDESLPDNFWDVTNHINPNDSWIPPSDPQWLSDILNVTSLESSENFGTDEDVLSSTITQIPTTTYEAKIDDSTLNSGEFSGSWLTSDCSESRVVESVWERVIAPTSSELFSDVQASDYLISSTTQIEEIKFDDIPCEEIDGDILPDAGLESMPSTSGESQKEQDESIDEANILEECIQNETTPPQKGYRSDSVDFALWALKNLLPEGRELDDKGSILHATADYIEELRGEINSNLSHLGTTEEAFWKDLEKCITAQKSSTNKARKVIKKESGPMEVKRPPNAFIRFSVEFRRMVAQDFPGRSNRDISQMLGSIWRRMSPAEKEPFVNDFYADLKQTRQLHPDWNYAGNTAKRNYLDLGDTQPERLRPRNPAQQMFYAGAFRKPSKRCKKEKKDTCNKNSMFWVQCDLCNKWRKCPSLNDSTDLPETWNCSLNPDTNHNSCDASEETD